MVRTVATRSIGGKALKKNTNNNKSGGKPISDKGGGNSTCPRETPSWQRPISNFLTMGFKNQGLKTPCIMDINQPSTSKAEFFIDFCEDPPVEVVVEVDVVENDNATDGDCNQYVNVEDEVEQPRKKIRYAEFCAHADHMESLPCSNVFSA